MRTEFARRHTSLVVFATMRTIKTIKLIVPPFHMFFGFLAVCSIAGACAAACTRDQRAVVRTVVDLVDQVCGDKDSLDDCLGKAQAARASAHAAAEAPKDAGTDR